MASPSTRTELQNYCKRQLGEPVLQVNVAQEQIDDLTDDALQKFAEWTYNGTEKMMLKHEITEDDVTRSTTDNDVKRSKADQITNVNETLRSDMKSVMTENVTMS